MKSYFKKRKKKFSFWCWRNFVPCPTVQVFIFYVFKEINFKWFLISGLALLHCHADFHMVLLKIKYQQCRHGNKGESAVLDIPGHLNVGKSLWGKRWNWAARSWAGCPRQRVGECEVRRDVAARAAQRGTAGEGTIRIRCLFLPDQGNLMCDLWLHIVG